MDIQYDKIYNILRIEGDVLVFDFQGVNFLNTFEVSELFALAIAKARTVNSYRRINSTEATGYLQRMNFFSVFEKFKKISFTPENFYTNTNDGLIELHGYDYKQQFESDQGRLFDIFKKIGLTDETISLVVASLSEVVDNTFSHNLGRWPLDISGRSVFLVQNFPKKKELCFSHCDFGVGFLETLKGNYPELKNNFEAIKLALEENVTARSPQRGGNGLIYLQQNVFNGFKGELLLRSGESLVKVKSRGNVIALDNNAKIGSGSNIFFSLKY